MDTRSTRTHNSRVFKIIVLILSCVMMFTGTFTLQQLYDFYSNSAASRIRYYSENILDIDSYNVLGNLDSDFAGYIRSDTRLALDLACLYISDQAVEDGTAFASREAELKKTIEKQIASDILEAKKSVIEDKYVYDYNHEMYTYPYPEDKNIDILEGFSSDDQIHADESSDGTTIVDGIKYYKGYPLDAVTVDESYYKSAAEAELKRQIIGAKAIFKSEYQNAKETLADRKNYSYFIVNKKTGDVYTNTKYSNLEEARKAALADKNGFGACFINSDLELNDNTFNASQYYGMMYYGSREVYEYSEANGNLVEILFGYGLDTLEKCDVVVHVNADEKTIVDGDVYHTLYRQFLNYKDSFKQNVALFITSATVWLVCMIILVLKAGEKDETGLVRLTPIDKAPNSIHLFISGALVLAIFTACLETFWDISGTATNMQLWNTVISCGCVIGNLIFAEWLMSVSRNIKRHKFLKNTITYKVCKLLIPKLCGFWNSENIKLRSRSLRVRLFFPFVAYFISLLVLIPLGIDASYNYGDRFWEVFIIFLIFAATAAAVIYLLRLAASLDSMDAALERARQGNFEQKLQVGTMPRVLQPLAEKTNNLTDGTKVAVDEAVRNERMKTELITNVSHDLKTPLTSIITYTDLLKHTDIDDEKALEYIGVLDEKSARLKKLIEDLVEASKASSGAIKLTLAQINMNELVEQVFGEYEDAFLENELDLRFKVPDEPIIAVADGQKTYRIIENLFSNVKKYAMPGTRVYLDLSSEDNFATVAIKNISKDEMSFDVERLTDRFVRGDESRSTEGSGLGLSIAKSLTELQGGKFEIDVDGDLFKVVINLPKKQ